MILAYSNMYCIEPLRIDSNGQNEKDIQGTILKFDDYESKTVDSTFFELLWNQSSTKR
jgi:hypothetical protein